MDPVKICKEASGMAKALALSCAVATFAASASEGDVLTVEKETVQTIDKDIEVKAVTVHGVLNVTGGNFKVVDGNPVYIDLGPDVGDVGEMTVTNAVIKEPATSAKICVRIGKNGGGDKAKLRLFKTSTKWSYLKNFILSSNAATEKERFESLEIGEGGFYRLNQIQNENKKPLAVSFSGEGAWIDKFWEGPLFSFPGGGDIVLQSVGGATIAISGYREAGAVASFFAADQEGCLKTEGTGDVAINLDGGYNGAPAVFCLNGSNVEWGHSGNLFIGDGTAARSGVFKVTANNALPYKATTGEVVVRSKLGGPANVLDLYGTSQRVRSIVSDGGSVVTNSLESFATLVFGFGDTDGRIAGVDLANSAVNCVKTGSGTLTLDGAALNVLSGSGGNIHVASPTYVGTLAITNVSLSFADGDSSLLTVGNCMVDSSVVVGRLSDGTATNCVFFKFPTMHGATVVKNGPGFVTYATPDDAAGTCLDVRAGVLRFGGESCTNDFWRLILKKANNNGRTYGFDDGCTKFISVGLGTFALFDERGAHTIGGASPYKCDTGDDPDNAAEIPKGGVATKNPALAWSTDICRNLHLGQGADPILAGAESRREVNVLVQNGNITDNRYDYPCTSTDYKPTLFNWTIGVMFDGRALDPRDPDTWEIITWRNSAGWQKSHVSYSMRRMPNWSHQDSPYLTDWELQSSPNGEPGTWITMDTRAGQRWWSAGEAGSSGLDPQYQFTYNNHVPYLFRSRNADWRFTTFGSVSVSPGATLDLSELREENIAFNGLKVDFGSGAGTITHFVPAEDGMLHLANVPEEKLASKKFRLPIVFGAIAAPERLASWSVSVNGETLRAMAVEAIGGELWAVRRTGFVVNVR